MKEASSTVHEKYQVMLEKIDGVCLAEKLCMIQLYDVQYNHFQSFVFGQEAMKTLTANDFLLEEHLSKKGVQPKMQSSTRHLSMIYQDRQDNH